MTTKKTLRIKYPQWHGGVNPNYVLGSNLLSVIAPPNPKDDEVEIKVDSNFDKTDKFEGIDCGEALLDELNQAYNILNEKSPTHVIVFGGDCSVSQARNRLKIKLLNIMRAKTFRKMFRKRSNIGKRLQNEDMQLYLDIGP